MGGRRAFIWKANESEVIHKWRILRFVVVLFAPFPSVVWCISKSSTLSLVILEERPQQNSF